MTVKDIDLQRVLHIHTVETLYAAVVDGYVESRGSAMSRGCCRSSTGGGERRAANEAAGPAEADEDARRRPGTGEAEAQRSPLCPSTRRDGRSAGRVDRRMQKGTSR